MIQSKLLSSLARLGVSAAWAMLAILAGCGSADKKPLLLLETPVQDYADAQTVSVTVTAADVPLGKASFPAAANNGSGKYGIYLAEGFSGTVAVAVAFLDGYGCTIASGSKGGVSVKAGETSGPYLVPMARSTDACSGRDAGATDAGPPSDGGGGLDAANPDLTRPSDAQPPLLDGGSADLPTLEVTAADAPADLAADASDAAALPDAPLTVDAAGGADVSTSVDVVVDAGPTPMSDLHTCTSYTHTKTFSTGPGDWAVLQTVFTPDKQHMVSFGQDGRAKVWDVAGTKLVESAGGLVFTGKNSMCGDISADGTLIAVGDQTPSLTVYDLASSLTSGGAVGGVNLPTAMVTAGVDAGGPLDSVEFVAFTKDGKHLIAAYLGYSQDDPNYLVLWSLTPSPSVVTKVPFPRGMRYWAYARSSYPGQNWVVGAGWTPTDADYRTTISLVDLGQGNPAKVEVMADSTPHSIAITGDAATVYVGFDSGELGSWDISDKTRIVRREPPLIAANGASWPPVVHAVATSTDGQYVAAGTDDDTTSAVKLFGPGKNQNISKAIAYLPTSLAFAPDNLAVVVGENNLGTILYCTP